jgi:predicted nucleic acid-binding protein
LRTARALPRIVVDASVAVKWLLPEDHSEAAARLLLGHQDLWAPDLIWAELGNVLWKKWRLSEISAETGAALLADFRRFPLSIQSSELLSEGAWEIARDLGRSFYDSLYLALAVSQGCPLVTADQKLWNALRGGPASASLIWVDDL